MDRQRKAWWPELMPALAGLVGCGLAGCGSADAKDAKSPGPPSARVAVGQVREGALHVRYRFLGDAASLAEADVAAGASGEVKQVLVREGDRVRKGQLLFQIDASVARAQLQAAERAQAALEVERDRATREAKRRKQAGREVVAEAEIDSAETEASSLIRRVEELSAAASERRAQLGRHRVRAPFGGVVAVRSIDPGDWVEPGSPALRLVDDENVQVFVDVHREFAPFVKRGMPAAIRRPGASPAREGDGSKRADTGERDKAGEHDDASERSNASEHDSRDEVRAVVRGVVRALDRDSRTLRLRLEPAARPTWLLAGTPVRAIFSVERSAPGAVLVPRDALVVGVAASRVARVVRAEDEQADSAELVSVDVIARGENEILVKSEKLRAGDAVVVRGNERLRPGQPVTVIEEHSETPKQHSEPK